MASEIGFGVVGLGMGRHHCNAIDRAEGARLVAVCDADEKRLEAGAEEFGCRGYTDYGSFLADQAVEVVNIATPSGSHAKLGIPAARAGKHLIVEKPADIAVERIDAMIAACEENGVKAAGIFQARLNALNIRIREAVASGRLGRLIGVHGHLPWYR
ncbi:MAG: Gfo/Idh/MocA family oxidoreductase, partial [Gemmatimonadetes bacterium]|nr:Gfo/Idh/MocA family oxidoreductase [Gemmatimonadota bacterium]